MRMRIIAVSAAFIALSSPVYSSESGHHWNATEEARFKQAEAIQGFGDLVMRSPNQVRMRAEVRSIQSNKDGITQITFHATGRFGKDREWDKIVAQISKDYLLTWKERGRPVPWFRNQQVRLSVNDSELVSIDMGIVKPQYFRYSSGGEVELLVRDADNRPILVRPHMLGDFSTISFDWIRGMGIVMTNYEAGPGDFEVEEPSSQSLGITPINAADHPVRLGLEGWRDIKSVQPKEDPPEGYIGHYRKLVPPSQRIKCAG